MLSRQFVGTFYPGKQTPLNLEAPMEEDRIYFKEIMESHKTRRVLCLPCGSHLLHSHPVYFLKVLCIVGCRYGYFVEDATEVEK